MEKISPDDLHDHPHHPDFMHDPHFVTKELYFTKYPYFAGTYQNTGLFQQILQILYQGMKGEAEAIAFYSKLLEQAPNETHRKYIRHAYEDEQKHLRMFQNLYISLTGTRPWTEQAAAPAYKSYKEGLKRAFEDELSAAELYRNAILLTGNEAVRKTFFEAMTDEMEHADRFSFLYYEG